MNLQLDETEWGFRVKRYEQLKAQFADRLENEIALAVEKRAPGRPEISPRNGVIVE